MINMIHYGPISTIIHMIKINTDVHSITTFLAIMGQGSPAEGLRPWVAYYFLIRNTGAGCLRPGAADLDNK